MSDPDVGGPGTKCVHAGERRDPESGALATPVYRTSTFRFATTDDLIAGSKGERPGFYTRYGHPNFDVVERKFAALHGAEGAVLFGSGLAALAGILQGLLRPGDRVVAIEDLYGGTRGLLRECAAHFGTAVAFVPTGDLAALAKALPGARLLLLEGPTNPLLRVVDLPRCAALAKANGVLPAFDNTFATPVNQRPLDLGADLVWESATKALGGHSDLLAGLVAGRGDLVAAVRNARKFFGAISDPDAAWLLARGMKTLSVRVRRQNESSLVVARGLEGRPGVSRVLHPGLASHPDHETARRLMPGGFGGMVTFACRGGAPAARALADRVRLIANAPSLGGVESLLSLPCLTSHAALTPAERASAGITDDLVRLSVGLEEPEDLLADLDAALA